MLTNLEDFELKDDAFVSEVFMTSFLVFGPEPRRDIELLYL